MTYKNFVVYFIHPDQKICDTVVQILREKEVEAFFCTKIPRKILKREQEFVYFLSIEEREDWDWRTFASMLLAEEKKSTLIALHTDKIPQGFKDAISGKKNELIEKIFQSLEKIKGKNSRDHVRFGSQNTCIATFEFYAKSKRLAGILHDLSTVAMSCSFQPEPSIPVDNVVDNMHINLPHYKTIVSGYFLKPRLVFNKNNYVFLFDKSSPEKEKEIQKKIHDFIYSSLEKKFYRI